MPLLSVNEEISNLIEENFNVLGSISLFDHIINNDYHEVIDILKNNKKDTFHPNDRFFVFHFDTDYYINNNYGVLLNNFFNILSELDIPLFTIIFYTNHFGIKKEIDYILRHEDKNNRPVVIENFMDKVNVPDRFAEEKNVDIDLNDIECKCLFLAKAKSQRAHRSIFFNQIKEFFPDTIMASIGKNT